MIQQTQLHLNKPLMAAYRLYLQPGDALHETWWQKWEMESLHALYGQLPASAKRPVDKILIARRQLPAWKPVELTTQQTALIRMQPVLPLLLTALGFQLLGCAKYLWLGPYRQKLRLVFSDAQCRQLAALIRPGESTTNIVPADLLDQCFSVGWNRVQGACKGDPLWQALQYTLPVNTAPETTLPSVCDPLAMLLRLERFL